MLSLKWYWADCEGKRETSAGARVCEREKVKDQKGKEQRRKGKIPSIFSNYKYSRTGPEKT